MTITEATANTLNLSVLERSYQSFELLAGMIERRESNETLVRRDQLETEGLSTQPFWETPGDMEGDTYREYISIHPEFDLTVRMGVFERLKKATRLLPGDWQMVIKAGFRPYAVQLAVLEAFLEQSRQTHPERNETQHLQHARTFVADPSIVCPAHTTGGAVDVDIKNTETGEYIDMGCPPNTDDERAFLHSDLISSVQHKNRMILLDAMLAVGFAPNPHEWWHYQYGETYWAAFYGHKTTLYDILEA